MLAACGEVFVTNFLAWRSAWTGFRPERYDLAGAPMRLDGASVISHVLRAAS